jgi:uncharacterized protein
MGVKLNSTEAAKWLREAAEQGNDLAQYVLGDLYSRGRGVTQDYAEAAEWYRKAAEQVEARALILQWPGCVAELCPRAHVVQLGG